MNQENVDQSESLTFNGPPLAKIGEQTMIQNISLNKIKLGKNSRLKLGKDELEGLMQSIKEVGLLQPIGVVKKAEGYEICYGNRRFLACSKLGLNKIPAIIHASKKESDIDLKNLTENIQRRNISLVEAGRYIELLKKEDMTDAEIAVRLGVTRNYVSTCLTAYNDVPDEFKSDLDVNFHKGHRVTAPGMIAPSVAKQIINAKKNYGLTSPQAAKLFKAAKGDKRFNSGNINRYAAALHKGSVDPMNDVDQIHSVNTVFHLKKKDYEKLMKEYVDDGPFNSFHALLVAVLKGEKSVRIPITSKGK